VRYLWDVPTVPNIPEHQWYNRDRIVAQIESPFYMRHVDVAKNLTGLAVACHSWTTVGFFARHVNSDRWSDEMHMMEVERVYGDASVWVYFPMTPGEMVCGFWVLTMLGGLATVAVWNFYSPFNRDTADCI
jgi:hypothetical protein